MCISPSRGRLISQVLYCFNGFLLYKPCSAEGVWTIHPQASPASLDSVKLNSPHSINMKFLSLLLAAPALVFARDLSTEVVKGTSTHYGGNLNGGTCSFVSYSLPAGIYGTAFSGSNWNLAGNCGACIEVTGPNGKKIKTMVSPDEAVPRRGNGS